MVSDVEIVAIWNPKKTDFVRDIFLPKFWLDGLSLFEDSASACFWFESRAPSIRWAVVYCKKQNLRSQLETQQGKCSSSS